LLSSEDIEEDWFRKYDDKLYSLENKLISYNRSLIEKLKNHDEWKSDYKVKDLVEKYDT
jgi:hypothetical protein